MVLTVRRRAPTSPPSPHTSTMMRHGHQMASKCDSELILPKERVKYVVVGNPEAMVGTSTAFYDLVHALPRRIIREPPKSPRKHSAILSHSCDLRPSMKKIDRGLDIVVKSQKRGKTILTSK